MAYNVILLRAARKTLVQLQQADYARVRTSIEALATSPRPAGCVKLTGSPYWCIRTGDYRVIYEIDDDAQRVTVMAIGHRRDVYR